MVERGTDAFMVIGGLISFGYKIPMLERTPGWHNADGVGPRRTTFSIGKNKSNCAEALIFF